MLEAFKQNEEKEQQEVLGFDSAYRSEAIQRMSSLLADLYAVYLKTQKFHWNARGARFRSAHNAFEDLYKVLADQVDDVAERIAALDGIAPGSYSEYEKLTNIEGHSALKSIDEMFHILSTDLEGVAKNHRSLVKFSEEHEDPVSADVVVSALRDVEKYSWMLRSNQIELRPVK